MLKLIQEVKALVPKWVSALLFLAGLKLIYPHWYEGPWNPRALFGWLSAFFLSACDFVNTVYDATPWWGIGLAIFLPISFLYCMATSSPEACAQIAAQNARDAAYLKEHEASHRWIGGWGYSSKEVAAQVRPDEQIKL